VSLPIYLAKAPVCQYDLHVTKLKLTFMNGFQFVLTNSPHKSH